MQRTSCELFWKTCQTRLKKNFIKADSRNLPKIDALMIYDFLVTDDRYNSSEVRGVKLSLWVSRFDIFCALFPKFTSVLSLRPFHPFPRGGKGVRTVKKIKENPFERSFFPLRGHSKMMSNPGKADNFTPGRAFSARFELGKWNLTKVPVFCTQWACNTGYWASKLLEKPTSLWALNKALFQKNTFWICLGTSCTPV